MSKIGHFRNSIILFVCPSKLCISIVSNLSWDLQWFQVKPKTMLMQTLEGQKKSIMVFLKVVYSRMPDDRPCQGGEWGRGGGPVSAAWILKYHVLVLCQRFTLLSEIKGNLKTLKKGCRFSRFHLTWRSYLLGHVTCRNLPWQSLWWGQDRCAEGEGCGVWWGLLESVFPISGWSRVGW